MSTKDDETLIMAAAVMQIMKVKNDQMRNAIAALEPYVHSLCERHMGGNRCTCGADEANAARAAARKAAGLED